MKEIIVKAIPFDKKLVTLSLESGVDGILAEKDKIKEVSALGRIKTFVPEDFEAISLNSKEDELLAEEYLKKGEKGFNLPWMGNNPHRKPPCCTGWKIGSGGEKFRRSKIGIWDPGKRSRFSSYLTRRQTIYKTNSKRSKADRRQGGS